MKEEKKGRGGRVYCKLGYQIYVCCCAETQDNGTPLQLSSWQCLHSVIHDWLHAKYVEVEVDVDVEVEGQGWG